MPKIEITTSDICEEGTIYLIPTELNCKQCNKKLDKLYCYHCNKQYKMEEYAKYFGMIKGVKS